MFALSILFSLKKYFRRYLKNSRPSDDLTLWFIIYVRIQFSHVYSEITKRLFLIYGTQFGPATGSGRGIHQENIARHTRWRIYESVNSGMHQGISFSRRFAFSAGNNKNNLFIYVFAVIALNRDNLLYDGMPRDNYMCNL